MTELQPDYSNITSRRTNKAGRTSVSLGLEQFISSRGACESLAADNLHRMRLLSGRFCASLRTAIFFVLLSTLATLSHGAVIATNVILRATTFPTNVFDVPLGKVFILEHVGFNNNWSAARQIVLANTVFDAMGATANDITVSYPTNFNTLSRPLKLTGNSMRIRCADRNAAAQWVVLYGLLVDREDLYAGIPSAIEGFAKEDPGPASGKIRLPTPRPSLVNVHQSTNLVNWVQATGAVVASSSGPAVKNFAVSPPSGDPKRFFRAAARARQTD